MPMVSVRFTSCRQPGCTGSRSASCGSPRWRPTSCMMPFVSVWQFASTFDPARGSPGGLADQHHPSSRARHGEAAPARGHRWLRSTTRSRSTPTPIRLPVSQGSSEGAALHRCLQELDTDKRRLIAMAFFDGLTHNQLAQHACAAARQRQVGHPARPRGSSASASTMSGEPDELRAGGGGLRVRRPGAGGSARASSSRPSRTRPLPHPSTRGAARLAPLATAVRPVRATPSAVAADRNDARLRCSFRSRHCRRAGARADRTLAIPQAASEQGAILAVRDRRPRSHWLLHSQALPLSSTLAPPEFMSSAAPRERSEPL